MNAGTAARGAMQVYMSEHLREATLDRVAKALGLELTIAFQRMA
jgi:hypothetical protein